MFKQIFSNFQTAFKIRIHGRRATAERLFSNGKKLLRSEDTLTQINYLAVHTMMQSKYDAYSIVTLYGSSTKIQQEWSGKRVGEKTGTEQQLGWKGFAETCIWFLGFGQ